MLSNVIFIQIKVFDKLIRVFILAYTIEKMVEPEYLFKGIVDVETHWSWHGRFPEAGCQCK